MATKSVTCQSCSRPADIFVPDDHDGTADYDWECGGCQERNTVPATAVPAPEVAEALPEGVEAKTDSDAGQGGSAVAS